MTLTGGAAPVTAVVLAATALAACGGSGDAGPPGRASAPAPAAAPTPRVVFRGISVAAVEHALLHPRGGVTTAAPHPVAARCRPPSAAELRALPFGRTRAPVVTCAMTIAAPQGGMRVAGTYDVQVLGNGCYVAERRARRPRMGQAVYGCGVSGAGR